MDKLSDFTDETTIDETLLNIELLDTNYKMRKIGLALAPNFSVVIIGNY